MVASDTARKKKRGKKSTNTKLVSITYIKSIQRQSKWPHGQQNTNPARNDCSLCLLLLGLLFKVIIPCYITALCRHRVYTQGRKRGDMMHG